MAGHVMKHEGPEVHYSDADEKLFAKISWHLLPLLTICYIISFLDRVNLGYALVAWTIIVLLVCLVVVNVLQRRTAKWTQS